MKDCRKSAWHGLCFILTLGSSPLFASEITAKDSYRCGLGLVTGKVSQPGSGEVALLGVPISCGIWFHPSLSWSAGIEGHLTPDLANPQLARKGIESTFSYHALGGSPEIFEGGGTIGVSKGYASSLSAVLKPGYFNYSISDAQRTSQKVSGAIATVKGGLAFRWYDYEIEGVATLFSIPAGTERIYESAVEIMLAYRWQS